MNSQFNHSANHSQIGIKPEQLDEIISAILAGKYSWACFLLLRCTGYNPLDYIPYRTSNRLLKENTQMRKSETQPPLSKIADLDYVEVVREKRAGVRGGCVIEAVSELHSDTAGFVAQVGGEGSNILAPAVDVPNQGFFAGFKARWFNLAGN
ncbi:MULTISPECIES: HetP family heterocyst commitment protein [unclassified Microcoleus]|uniref:HetP family heterocyst commitment protein n=1 Tax=unclassified Microcoleus TaxID=2642155 RepID=UPI0025DF01D3|nr:MULTISPECIES: HetP family heterocyst commitment protein [unclassified Microcoleus]